MSAAPPAKVRIRAPRFVFAWDVLSREGLRSVISDQETGVAMTLFGASESEPGHHTRISVLNLRLKILEAVGQLSCHSGAINSLL